MASSVIKQTKRQLASKNSYITRSLENTVVNTLNNIEFDKCNNNAIM